MFMVLSWVQPAKQPNKTLQLCLIGQGCLKKCNPVQHIQKTLFELLMKNQCRVSARRFLGDPVPLAVDNLFFLLQFFAPLPSVFLRAEKVNAVESILEEIGRRRPESQ